MLVEWRDGVPVLARSAWSSGRRSRRRWLRRALGEVEEGVHVELLGLESAVHCVQSRDDVTLMP